MEEVFWSFDNRHNVTVWIRHINMNEKSPSTFKTSKYKDLLVLKRKEKCRLEQKNAEILQKRLSTENENCFNLVKRLETLNYMETISVRQKNRSTDFLEEKWLNFWKKYNTILIIVGKDCGCTVPKRNWHYSKDFLIMKYFVVPYLRGIDTRKIN